MSWFSGLVVYFLVWWMALFCILPIGVKPDPQGRLEEGGWRGAPVAHRLGWKVLWTTLLSGVIWLGIYALIASDLISFRSEWLAIPD
jgi:predicted secreted protein